MEEEVEEAVVPIVVVYAYGIRICRLLHSGLANESAAESMTGS